MSIKNTLLEKPQGRFLGQTKVIVPLYVKGIPFRLQCSVVIKQRYLTIFTRSPRKRWLGEPQVLTSCFPSTRVLESTPERTVSLNSCMSNKSFIPYKYSVPVARKIFLQKSESKRNKHGGCLCMYLLKQVEKKRNS